MQLGVDLRKHSLKFLALVAHFLAFDDCWVVP